MITMKKTHKFLKLAIVSSAIILFGCAGNKPVALYDWGQYQSMVYARYSDPGKVPAQAMIEQLEKDYQIAQSGNKKMPPGWHAYLGFLYLETGRQDSAVSSFLTEKAQFPESTRYMDFILSRLTKKSS
jgi:hypothetical protein